jgi:putative mRNA 3-end processing factor
MNVEFLGGTQEVGRSAILVTGGEGSSGRPDSDDTSLLLDFGMLTANPPQWPVGMDGIDPDAVVVSHGHLDHVGALPALLSGTSRPDVHWTPPTREFAMRLGRDTLKLHGGTPQCPFTETELRRLTEVSVEHGYGESFTAAGFEVTFYEAGHIPGSAHVLLDDGETRLLYTGDFHTENQRLVSGTTERPEADVVICESTYSDVDHEPRAEVERGFADAVRETLYEGGTVVVPAFAIGRTQEMLMVCEAHDLPCYVDGMGKELTRMLQHHPAFLRDPDAFGRAVGNARFVTGRDGQRKRIADDNTVVVTTSGMLSGGPAMTYVPEIRGHPKNRILFSGYQVEGTPGRELLETGSAEIDGRVMRVAARTERFDFSAHADHGGLRSFLDAYTDARVLVNHGDRCEAFAEELRADGYDAHAPELGESVTVRRAQSGR